MRTSLTLHRNTVKGIAEFNSFQILVGSLAIFNIMKMILRLNNLISQYNAMWYKLLSISFLKQR
jgi:hypothetical protein